MRHSIATWMAVGWLLGASTIGLGAVVGANWYEYRTLDPDDDFIALVNRDGWEPLPVAGERVARYYRRPRLRLH